MSNDKYLFNIKTVQTGAIRILIESLKEILNDANFTIDKNGIKLVATDSTCNVLVHMKLLADKFEYFLCNKKINIGLNLSNFYKLIKTMSNNDTLTLFMEKNDENQLGIKIHNDEKNSQTTYNWKVKCDSIWVIGPNFTTSCFAFNFNVTNASCDGNSDGAIDLNLSGGFPSYTYSWSSTTHLSFSETTEDIDTLFSSHS